MSRKTLRSVFEDESFNPCIDEGKISEKCIKENYLDLNKCAYQFENYRNCKKFWGVVKRYRANHSIEPILPGKEEREKILRERQNGNIVYQMS